MTFDAVVPNTRVLAVASHVTHGYVGNKMATFVLQVLGCDVCAINTVNFSNHTAYRQFTGRKTPASEILELYDGLEQACLNDFDLMLSGYIASEDAVRAVGKIGQDLRRRSSSRPGSFFWVLDPVMGDNGRLYVNKDIVPVYQSLLPHADLILPNAFEAQVLTGVEITDRASLVEAVRSLHLQYRIPHVVITSLRIALHSEASAPSPDELVVVGSSRTSDNQPRLFSVTVPALPVFFSGTGDLFAALMSVRLREAVLSASQSLADRRSWLSSDEVQAPELPLAHATKTVLTSMHSILTKTAAQVDQELSNQALSGQQHGEMADIESERIMHLQKTRASEVEVVRHVDDIRNPVPGSDGIMLNVTAVPL